MSMISSRSTIDKEELTMIEKLFAAYTEKAHAGRDIAFDKLLEAIQRQDKVDESITAYTLEVEQAAYRVCRWTGHRPGGGRDQPEGWLTD